MAGVLRRGIAVLITAAAAWAAVGTDAAASPATRFAVTAEGTQTTVVTRVRRSTDDFGCTTTRRDADRQTLAFASRGTSVIAAGAPATARVAVTVRASGTRRATRTFTGATPDCEAEPETSDSRCGPVRLAAHVVVRLPRRGTVAVAGSVDRLRDAARCAPGAAPARRFLTASEGQFPAALLRDPSASRVILRGNARFTDTLATGARRVTIVRWTVTLRRLS